MKGSTSIHKWQVQQQILQLHFFSQYFCELLPQSFQIACILMSRIAIGFQLIFVGKAEVVQQIEVGLKCVVNSSSSAETLFFSLIASGFPQISDTKLGFLENTLK